MELIIYGQPNQTKPKENKKPKIQSSPVFPFHVFSGKPEEEVTRKLPNSNRQERVKKKKNEWRGWETSIFQVKKENSQSQKVLGSPENKCSRPERQKRRVGGGGKWRKKRVERMGVHGLEIWRRKQRQLVYKTVYVYLCNHKKAPFLAF